MRGADLKTISQADISQLLFHMLMWAKLGEASGIVKRKKGSHDVDFFFFPNLQIFRHYCRWS